MKIKLNQNLTMEYQKTKRKIPKKHDICRCLVKGGENGSEEPNTKTTTQRDTLTPKGITALSNQLINIVKTTPGGALKE